MSYLHPILHGVGAISTDGRVLYEQRYSPPIVVGYNNAEGVSHCVISGSATYQRREEAAILEIGRRTGRREGGHVEMRVIVTCWYTHWDVGSGRKKNNNKWLISLTYRNVEGAGGLDSMILIYVFCLRRKEIIVR